MNEEGGGRGAGDGAGDAAPAGGAGPERGGERAALGRAARARARARARRRRALASSRAEAERRGRETQALRRDVERERRLADRRAELLGRELAARRSAERANRLKDEFLATVSHELRAPLAAILGWASLLAAEREPDAAALAKGLDVIARSARSQKRLVEDILDVARILRGKLRLDPETVDLCPLAREALDALQPLADAKGVELALEGDDAPCRVVGDGERLRQVVWNLLVNGLKFTPAGGRVSLRLGRQGADAFIEVRDTGRGIERSFLPHVFERFRQAEGAVARGRGGLGLGLAIVRHLVEVHGGRVEAASSGAGRGAAFTVLLPLEAVAAPPRPEATHEPERPPRRDDAPERPAHFDDAREGLVRLGDAPERPPLLEAAPASSALREAGPMPARPALLEAAPEPEPELLAYFDRTGVRERAGGGAPRARVDRTEAAVRAAAGEADS